MDALPELSFSSRTNWLHDIPSEAIIDLPLIVVNRNDRIREMPDVAEHVEWVLKCHQVIVHLVESMSVANDLFEEGREVHPLPIEESASSSLAHHGLPAADNLEFPIPVVDLLDLTLREDICADQIHAVAYHRFPECIVASFVALKDGHHELQHVVLDSTTFHSIDFLHALLNESSDELARVPVDENDPFVDQELLRSELNLDCFEHFYSLDNQGEGLLRQRGIIYYEE